jgi:2-C-methyl-D-erythritol 4-phosphate cytidylyltransferase
MPVAVIFPLVPPGYLAGTPGGKHAMRLFAKLDGREVFLRCVELYTPRDQVAQRIVVATPDDLGLMQERYSAHLGFQGVTVTAGGSDWFSCVARGLEKLKPEVDTVLVHDPCCPAVPFTLLDALEDALARNKAAAGVVPAVPARSGFADVDGPAVAEYVDMAKVLEVQSPQIFRRPALAAAYASRGANTYVDDAELVAAAGGRILTLPGSRFNQRIDSDDMVRLGKDLLEHLPRPKSKTPLAAFGEAEW